MHHTTAFQNTVYLGMSMFILLLSVIIIVVGIILIHDLPYHIAKRRNHPQQDAIRCMAVMGLVLFPLWLLSMVWAYMRSEISFVGGKHVSKNKEKEDSQNTEDKPKDKNDENNLKDNSEVEEGNQIENKEADRSLEGVEEDMDENSTNKNKSQQTGIN